MASISAINGASPDEPQKVLNREVQKNVNLVSIFDASSDGGEEVTANEYAQLSDEDKETLDRWHEQIKSSLGENAKLTESNLFRVDDDYKIRLTLVEKELELEKEELENKLSENKLSEKKLFEKKLFLINYIEYKYGSKVREKLKEMNINIITCTIEELDRALFRAVVILDFEENGKKMLEESLRQINK